MSPQAIRARKRHHRCFASLLLIAFLFALTACSKLDGESVIDAYQAHVIEGYVTAGTIANADIHVFPVEKRVDGYQISDAPLPVSTTTDNTGYFRLVLPDGVNSDSLIVQASNQNSKAHSRCIQHMGCGRNSSGQLISYGARFVLSESFKLTAAISDTSQDRLHKVSVSPLSHFAVSRVHTLSDAFSSASLASSYEYVESIFGLSAGALNDKPVDLDQLTQASGDEKSGTKLAMLSASFIGFLNTPDWSNLSEVMAHLAERSGRNGFLTLSNQGALPDIALDDLYYYASEMSSSHALILKDSPVFPVLNELETEFKQAYQLVIEAAESIEPAAIAQQPQSQTINVDEALELVLEARGGKPFSYQWRHNGIPISNADSPSLLLEGISVKQGGLYDVIVSNRLGSVVSSEAQVTVIQSGSVGDEPTIITEDELSRSPAESGPSSAEDFATVREDHSLVIDVLANDISPNQDAVQITWARVDPLYGKVLVNYGKTLSYIPAANFNGVVEIEYRVADSSGRERSETAFVTVLPENDPPIAQDDSITGTEDTVFSIDVLENDKDVDGDKLKVTGAIVLGGGAQGSVVAGEGALIFRPTPNLNGKVVIQYAISDSNGASATGNVTINIQAINDAPVARDDIGSTPEDSAILMSVLDNDSDADGDTLLINRAETSTGKATIVNKNIRFEPELNFHGLATIRYSVIDTFGGIDHANVVVTVNAINDDPVARSDIAEVREDHVVRIPVLNNDYDPDGDSLSISGAILREGSGEVRVEPDGTLRYTPAKDFVGKAFIIYTVQDNHGGSSTASAEVQVLEENDPPVAINDKVVMKDGVALEVDVLKNDYDPEGLELSVKGVNVLNGDGDVTINDSGELLVQPALSYQGNLEIEYQVADIEGATAKGLVLVEVQQEEIVEPSLPVSNGEVRLSWEMPRLRENGDELKPEEIGGYEISMAQTEQEITSQVQLQGAGSTSYLVQDLSAGIYYFRVATVDSEGVRGMFSHPMRVEIVAISPSQQIASAH